MIYLGHFFFLIVLALSWPAQQTPSLAPETIKKIDEIVASERDQKKITGLSVAVAVNNRLVYSKGSGFADLENSLPATPETVYRTASIAKAMTATAVLLLAEQGKLDLDAPVQKYCPAFPVKTWPLTSRQLLGHLGGIRHYKSPQEATGTQSYDSVGASLAIFKDEPLLHEPGTKFSYTTFGYSVLGCAIEGAAGVGYIEFMIEHVFRAAGMTQTGLDHARLVIPHRARGYLRMTTSNFLQLSESERRMTKVGELYNAALHDTSMKIPGGGLVSTAADLVRFAIAVNTGKLLNEKTRKEMWSRQKTRDGQETTYGLGWQVEGQGERMLVSHSGGQAGTSTLLTMMPAKGSIIAVMSNLQGANLGDLVSQIGRIIVPNQNPTQ